ncbi:MAG: ATP-dependent helicase [Lentisphaerae bacterium]|nr:ATP-dependent helicase [Lentisphaerota bacterium]
MGTDSRNGAEKYAWLDELNPAQRRAVTHGAGPLLIVAGAGTGKTRTLACRVAYLIARGTDPGRILLLTFTRRAAQEMLSRAAAVIERGTGATARAWGGTFHAIGNRLLRIYAKAAGLNAEFTVMDEGDAEDLLNVIRHDMGLHGREKRFPRKRTCLAVYSRCVNGVESLPEVLKRFFPWCADWEQDLKELFRRYVARKQEQNVLDYDDLLLYWMRLLGDERVARQISGRFDHVLVDEYQDTNRVQAEILRGMRRGNDNITVVGDDAQSIYSFRGATVRNMLDFPRHFPGTAIAALEQNYRSVQPILETTNRLIAQSRERYTKDLWSARPGGAKPRLVTCRDEDAQNAYVIGRVLEHYEQGIPLRRQAVLFRAAYLSATLEVELGKRNIRYQKYGGLRFLEAAHVKDLVAVLRVMENPRDRIAWFRLLQLMDGVGPATAQRVIDHVQAAGNDPRAASGFTGAPAAQDQLRAFGAMAADILAPGGLPPASQVERVRRFYAPLLKKRYENPRARERDLESLEQIAGRYRSRRKFLSDLQLDPPRSTGDLAGPPLKDEDWLVLSTIHSAKGCEWDAVFLIHASDGCLPSDMATDTPEEIEEELRLAYVAMTRAKDHLYVTWPLRYYHTWHPHTDRHSYAQPSRFLTPEVVARMEGESAGEMEREDESSGLAARRDIAAEIRSMWE